MREYPESTAARHAGLQRLPDACLTAELEHDLTEESRKTLAATGLANDPIHSDQEASREALGGASEMASETPSAARRERFGRVGKPQTRAAKMDHPPFPLGKQHGGRGLCPLRFLW